MYVRSGIDSRSKTDDFEIENGVLLKYRGSSDHAIIPEGVKEIGYHAFDSSDVVYVRFPDSLRKIGDSAFVYAENLESIKLPKNVSILGDSAFRFCSSLRTVQLNEGLTKIGVLCFGSCKALKHLDIPQTVKRIGEGAFDWSGIETLTMPNIKIRSDLFDECPYIRSVNGQDPDLYSVKDTKMTFGEWYSSPKGDSDNDSFSEKLEDLVRDEFDVSDYFEEPSIQGFSGADYINITLQNGREYSFNFAWRAMQEKIYSGSPEAAANYYFKRIKRGIDSSSALVENTPML